MKTQSLPFYLKSRKPLSDVPEGSLFSCFKSLQKNMFTAGVLAVSATLVACTGGEGSSSESSVVSSSSEAAVVSSSSVVVASSQSSVAVSSVASVPASSVPVISSSSSTAFVPMPSEPVVVYAVNAGGPAFTGADGVEYAADENFSAGRQYTNAKAIAGTEDDVLYQSERYHTGAFSYDIDLPDGVYTVVLKFAEIYHTSENARVAGISIEGTNYGNVDIVKEVGPMAAYDVEHAGIVVSDGELNINLSPSADNPKISGIVIKSLPDGKYLYGQQCASCHGDESGNNATSGGALTKSQCTTCGSFDQLRTFIDVLMPKGNPAQCSGECAEDIATYILSNFAGYNTPEVGVSPAPGAEFTCAQEILPPEDENLVRRLTRGDYIRTIRDVTGLDVSAAAEAIPDQAPTFRSFNNNAIEVSVSRAHIDTFNELAADIAPQLDAWLNGQKSCSNFQDSCESGLINNLALKLYRAPVNTAEMAALREIFDVAQENDASFDEGASLVLQAMLQGPRFLYRIEREVGDGSVKPLQSYELASRLSYGIWGSAPDDALLAAAAQGTNQVLAQIDRMLNDSKALEYGAEFFADWFDLHRMDSMRANADQFPGFNNDLFVDMKKETEATFRKIISQEQKVTSMYNLQETTVSRALAQHYNLPSPKTGTATYDLSGIPERGGLFTQGSITTIGGNESSTVRRGLFMLDQVLCGKMASPPENVPTTPIPSTPDQSIRDVSETRTDHPVCGVCHQQFEPLVWGMVPFNAVGEYHLVDEFGHNLPEDGYVVIPPSDDKINYSSVNEMADILAASPRTMDCATLKSFEYLMAREVTTADACSLADARNEISSSGGSYQDMLRALLMTEKFRNIKTEAN